MSPRNRRKLLEGMVRLRRAERRLPGDRDLVAVRALLEDELGPTVSRRIAAEALGVSHTALRRWIDAGDLPVVQAASGRLEVPVAALLDLIDKVDRQRREGSRTRHVIEPVVAEGREQADRVRPKQLVERSHSELGGHDRAEARSLAYHRALAPRLRRAMVVDALHLIWKWREQGKIDPRYAARWERVLNMPVPMVRRVISSDDPEARDLRQNSPFAGMLSEPERLKILREIR